MRRYINLYKYFVKYSVMRTMEKRVDFILRVIPSIVRMIITFVTVVFVYNFIDSIAGWTRSEMILLMGAFTIVDAVYFSLGIRNISRLNTYVNKGTLDSLLLKPVSSIFMVCSQNGVNLGRLIDVFAGIGMIVYAISDLGITLSRVEILVFVFLLVCGAVLSYLFWLIIMTFSFWTGRVDGLHEVWLSLMQINRYPIDIFPDIFQKIVLWFIPMATVVRIPTKFVLGEATIYQLVWMPVAVVMVALIAKRFWYKGLANYSSASS